MTREEIINRLKPLCPTASEIVASDGGDTQVMYLEDVADAVMNAQISELVGNTLEVKARLAASIFGTLAEHKGCGMLHMLTKEVVETTNEIFKGINIDLRP